jgi:hypothetical protein
MIGKYVAPEYNLKAFNCPHCQVYAHQSWHKLDAEKLPEWSPPIADLWLSICVSCIKWAVWVECEMVYPVVSIAPFASEDMPDDVKSDFNEARSIVNLSPRASAALLRLSLQKLMKHLDEKSKDLNNDIANLVKKGLPEKIQKALDSVRVIGNNAVHPGKIDLKDDIRTVSRLFELLNFIVEFEITTSKKIEEIYRKKVPEGQRDQIKKRDGKK